MGDDDPMSTEVLDREHEEAARLVKESAADLEGMPDPALDEAQDMAFGLELVVASCSVTADEAIQAMQQINSAFRQDA